MLGENVPLQISNPNVQASAKKYRGKLYVLVTNPTDEESEVTLNLAGLPKMNEGTFLDGQEKVKVEHFVDKPNSISLKLEALQSETLVFDLT